MSGKRGQLTVGHPSVVRTMIQLDHFPAQVGDDCKDHKQNICIYCGIVQSLHHWSNITWFTQDSECQINEKLTVFSKLPSLMVQ